MLQDSSSLIDKTWEEKPAKEIAKELVDKATRLHKRVDDITVVVIKL